MIRRKTQGFCFRQLEDHPRLLSSTERFNYYIKKMVAMAEREEAQEKIYNKKVDFNRVIEEGWVFRDALKERHFSKNVWGAFEYSHYVCLNINRDLQEEGDKYKNTKPLVGELEL